MAELVFIPAPGIGHLVSTLQIVKILVDRDDRLFITVLVMSLPSDNKVSTYIKSMAASSTLSNRIKFIHLPNDDHLPETNPKLFLLSFIESQKPHVKQVVITNQCHTHTVTHHDSPRPRLAGFVLDMFCTTMIDVANDFGLPSYIFFTSAAAFLGLIFFAEETLVTTELTANSDTELVMPNVVNPIPARVLPTVLLDNERGSIFVEQAKRIRETKGIMVNTFIELEAHAVRSLITDSKNPPLYSVGPILNLEGEDMDRKGNIMRWLDDQPASSVVFLCFGSMGSFDGDQVKEIACGLEQSGHRFLWSLRQPPAKGKFALPDDYTNLAEALPEGFLDRTVEIGMVIGWAPQVSILAHPAIGGFVSHCGWNSTLESIWFGVPIATWPMYAEQQFNAFLLVKELGLAVEIRMDYRKDFMSTENPIIVPAQEIERGIRSLMKHDHQLRNRVKDMSDKSRKALMEPGSSYSSLQCFVAHVIKNMP